MGWFTFFSAGRICEEHHYSTVCVQCGTRGLSAFGGKAEISGETEEEISQNAVNIIFNHDEPTNDILDPKIPFSYTLPAGSTITVKNETMKAAAEAAVSEQYKDNVTVRIATKTSEGFELARNAFILSKEEQAQLCWTMIPADTTENVTWQSKIRQLQK